VVGPAPLDADMSEADMSEADMSEADMSEACVAGSGFCAMASARGAVRSLKQYRHLIASSWISSAQ